MDLLTVIRPLHDFFHRKTIAPKTVTKAVLHRGNYKDNEYLDNVIDEMGSDLAQKALNSDLTSLASKGIITSANAVLPSGIYYIAASDSMPDLQRYILIHFNYNYQVQFAICFAGDNKGKLYLRRQDNTQAITTTWEKIN